jgi:hypothetical protein
MIGNEGEEGKSHTSATTAHDMLLQSPKPLCHLPPAAIPDPTFFGWFRRWRAVGNSAPTKKLQGRQQGKYE